MKLLDAASTLLTSEAFFIHLLHRLYVSTRVSIFSRREALNLVDIGLSLSFYGAAALSIYAESPDFGKISGDYTFNIFYKLFSVISLGIFQAQKPMKGMNKSYIFK